MFGRLRKYLAARRHASYERNFRRGFCWVLYAYIREGKPIYYLEDSIFDDGVNPAFDRGAREAIQYLIKNGI